MKVDDRSSIGEDLKMCADGSGEGDLGRFWDMEDVEYLRNGDYWSRGCEGAELGSR